MNEQWAEELAIAIVMQACKDYEYLLRTGRKFIKTNDKKETKETLENFFRSEWFRTLTDLDADYLIKGIERKVGI